MDSNRPAGCGLRLVPDHRHGKYPDATVIDFTYDPLGRMASVVTGARTTTYAYDPASNLVTSTLPSQNGYVETRVYDRAGRLNGVRNVKGATTLADISYVRDPVGNPLSETRLGASPVSKTFSYDSMDRLTGVCFLATTCPNSTDPFIRWTYVAIAATGMVVLTGGICPDSCCIQL